MKFFKKYKYKIKTLIVHRILMIRKYLGMPIFLNAIYLKDEKNKIILESSPKVGSVIWTKMFFDNLGILDEALQYSPWIHDYRIKVYAPRHIITINDLINTEYKKIKVVRNPYARVVSSYIYLMRQNNNTKVISKIKKNLLLTKLKVKSVNDISFRLFVDFLSRVDLYKYNPHIAPQFRWYEIFFTYDYICKVEKTKDEVNKINQNFGINFNPIFDSEHHVDIDGQVSGNVSDMSWKVLVNKVPSYENFYDDRLRAKINKLYKKDIKKYNYTYESFIEYYCKQSL